MTKREKCLPQRRFFAIKFLASTIIAALLFFPCRAVKSESPKTDKNNHDEYYRVELFYLDKSKENPPIEESVIDAKGNNDLFPMAIVESYRKNTFLVDNEKSLHLLISLSSEKEEIIGISSNSKYILARDYSSDWKAPYIYTLYNFQGKELCKIASDKGNASHNTIVTDKGIFVVFGRTRSIEVNTNMFDVYDKKCEIIGSYDYSWKGTILQEQARLIDNQNGMLLHVGKGDYSHLEAFSFDGSFLWSIASNGGIRDFKFTQNGKRIFALISLPVTQATQLNEYSDSGELVNEYHLDDWEFQFENGKTAVDPPSQFIISPEGDYALIMHSWWSALVETKTGHVLWKKNNSCSKSDYPRGILTHNADNIILSTPIKNGPDRIKVAPDDQHVCVLDRNGSILFEDIIEIDDPELWNGKMPLKTNVVYGADDSGDTIYVLFSSDILVQYTRNNSK